MSNSFNLLSQIVDIVLGNSYEEKEKTKTVYSLIQKYNYNLCCRFNGSINVGYTIYHQNKKFILHQLPIGCIFLNTYNLISSDCLIDLSKLKKEILDLNKNGISIKNRLFISKACHLITQEYDSQNNKIGTTGSGINPIYSLKMIRIEDLDEKDREELINLGIEIVDMRKFWFEHSFSKILLEGVQEFELDINLTNQYPYFTSSNCTLGNAINVGIQLKNIRNIYGVNKVYDTYEGILEFQPKDDKDLEKIVEIGQEYGFASGRKIQCNYLNLDRLIESLYINNCNICVFNKYDVLEKVGVFKLYYQNELKTFSNWLEMCNFITLTLENTFKFKNNSIELIFSKSQLTIFDEQEKKRNVKSLLYSS